MHEIRWLIDNSLALKSTGKLALKHWEKEEYRPTPRAQLLYTLNPTTFKDQNIDGKLDKILEETYHEALAHHKREL